MKKIIAILIICYFLVQVQAQIGINTDNSTPDTSAMLDIKSSNKGVLIPRMDSTSRKNIMNPAEGLLVFDSTTNTFWYYDTIWNEIRNGSSQLSGTDLLGTVPSPDFSCINIASRLSIGESPRSVAVAGNYAYVVDSDSDDFKVIRISDPSSPVILGSLTIVPTPISLTVLGNYAYVVDYFTGLKVIDISDPTSPSLTSSFPTGLGNNSVAVLGDYAYVVNQETDDLKAINISNPNSLVLEGSLTIGSTPTSVAVSGNYAYVVDSGSDDLKVINISNPNSLVLEGSLTIGSTPTSVAVSGNYAYVVDSGSEDLKVINISNPNSVVLRGSVTIGSVPQSVVVSGAYAYIVDFQSSDLKVIHLTCPSLLSINPQNGTFSTILANDLGFDYLNDEDLFFRKNLDQNHGLGWYGAGKLFDSINVDGPALYGFSGGALGSNQNGTQNIVLQWTASGRVGIGTPNPSTTLEVNGTLTATAFNGNGSGLTNVPGDNLGNHTASQAFNLSTNDIVNADTITAVAFNGSGAGLTNVPGDDLGNHTASQAFNLSTNDIINGDTITAVAFNGSGAGLTNVPGDNLGNHIATSNVQLGSNWLSGDGNNEGLFIDGSGRIGIGTDAPSEKLGVVGNIRIYNNDLYLREDTTDRSHGLGWYGGSKPFSAVNVDGPVLYGYGGGALGINQNGTQKIALQWTTEGNINTLNNDIYLASQNHGLGYYGASKTFTAIDLDGPVLYGWSGGALGSVQYGTQHNIALRWTDTGRVGIGTTNPTKAKLEISGFEQNISLNYGYLNVNGHTGTNAGNNPLSLYASHRIAAAEFNAFSDARIKNILGSSNSQEDLNTLMGIQITDYQHIDTIQNGTASKKKVIAQQVVEVFPQAVTKNTREVIPDIYQRAELRDNWIYLTTNLQTGDRVKIITENSNDIHKVTAVEKDRFKVSDLSSLVSNLFVYGKEVDDFHTVDYEAIAMLNVSATQAQQQHIEALEAEIGRLKAQLSNIESLLQGTASKGK